jgi:hypothetical protein
MIRTTNLLVFMLAGGALLSAGAQRVRPTAEVQRKYVPRRATNATVKQPAATPAPVEPVVITPPTPEQQPASAPEVSYANGMLTITAQNSTLSDILAAVRASTGATIEAPPATLNERVATRLGPGPARDVLASLLKGSRFDYILLGSLEDPQGVERIVLTAKTGGASTTASSMPTAVPAVPRPVRPAPDYAPPSEPVEEEAEQPVMTEDGEPDMQEQPQQPGGQPNVAQPATPPLGVQPSTIPGASIPGQPIAPSPAQQPQSAIQPPNTSQANPDQPQVKTPEQLLRELQRLQNQQKNQQQEQPHR